jgi:hypothetical protein
MVQFLDAFCMPQYKSLRSEFSLGKAPSFLSVSGIDEAPLTLKAPNFEIVHNGRKSVNELLSR